jgi:hypothetical protein
MVPDVAPIRGLCSWAAIPAELIVSKRHIWITGPRPVPRARARERLFCFPMLLYNGAVCRRNIS